MAVFTTPVDVANRALQIIGVPRVASFTESTKAAAELLFCTDKLRRAELRRSVWTFATRRAVLRPFIAGTTPFATFLAWSSVTTYGAADVVLDSAGFPWISTRASNLNNTTGAGGVNPAWIAYFGPQIAQVWSSAIAYFPGDVVIVSSVIYIATATSTNQTPPNATYWHAVAGAVGTTLVQYAPLGVNPPTGATTRTLYRLPANYVRLAPQDPKAAATARQGVTAGMMYNDWEIESGYLFTADASPIIFRFVADETDVTLMDDLFCETWAARIATEVCLPLTQSVEKLNAAIGHYRSNLDIAKAMNAVEEGSTEGELPEGSAPQGQPAQRGQ